MISVILTVHVLIILAMIGVVLLQRSEGGALGMGGGGGGFMTGRGAANALTRTTSILAALFFATSLGLAILADTGESEESVFDELTGAPAVPNDPATTPATTDDLLRTLGADETNAASGLAAPVVTDAPADATGTDGAPDAAAPAEEPAGPDEDPNN